MNAIMFNIMFIIIEGELLKNIFSKKIILTMNTIMFNFMYIIIKGELLKNIFSKKK